MGTRKDLARLTSYVLNPYLVSLATIILLSYKSAESAAEGFKWSLVLTGGMVAPVLAIIVYLVYSNRIESAFANVRSQRNLVYLVASGWSALGIAVLVYLRAPTLLIAAQVAVVAALVAFMVINLAWKISLHTAFIAAATAMLTVTYGPAGAMTAALLPPAAWARVELAWHSPAQVTAGALLAGGIVAAVFHFFGVMNPA
ncbi:MAG: hypothetical protein HYX91_03730 [Chloroflexi bacterium]|nr:hypothetical protein [Chloroflexota bacterium]